MSTDPYQTPSAIQDAIPKDLNSLKDILFKMDGRITRSKWWLYAFLLPILLFLPGLILTAISPTLGGILILITYIPVVWISICVNAKRWHDRDKSGWWTLIGLIPFGGIWVLIECGCLEGTQGPNQFGPQPK